MTTTNPSTVEFSDRDCDSCDIAAADNRNDYIKALEALRKAALACQEWDQIHSPQTHCDPASDLLELLQELKQSQRIWTGEEHDLAAGASEVS